MDIITKKRKKNNVIEKQYRKSDTKRQNENTATDNENKE